MVPHYNLVLAGGLGELNLILRRQPATIKAAVSMEDVPFLVAFGGGLLSFLSPCVLALVPVYLAIIAGPLILSSKAGPARVFVFLHSLSFVLGFSVVFILLGAAAGLMGVAIGAHTVKIRQLAGSLLIVLGLFLLLALKVPWLNFEKRLATGRQASIGYLAAFLTGGIFALGWTPCVGPILGGILTLALATSTALKGAYLLAIYSLGLGLPFLVIGAAFDAMRPYLRRIQHYAGIIHIVSGVLLIAVGILMLDGKLALFLI